MKWKGKERSKGDKRKKREEKILFWKGGGGEYDFFGKYIP